MIYIKRICRQDLTKEIAIPSYNAADAFGYDARNINLLPRDIVMRYSQEDALNCFDTRIELNIHVPGNERGDEARFSKPLQNFLNEHGIVENDVIVFVIGNDLQNIDFYCIQQNNPSYAIYDNLLQQTDKKRDNQNHRLVVTNYEVDNRHNSNAIKSYLAALRTKPFMLLAGISGTGKSRIVRKLAQASVTEDLQRLYDPQSVEYGFNRWELHKPANFELVQVKPNWHNSLEVVGYKSNIGGVHYEYTPFVEFVARAWKHPEIPFFLCLDEMNLAPVEQYFAEFLSAIESRSYENGEYETDPIIKPFKEFEDDLCNEMIKHLIGINDLAIPPESLEGKLISRYKNKGLTLPKNLLVLGTVNMDETTFSFSRKVLDRAMSIVMNDVEYDDFFDGTTENDVTEMNDDVKELLINRMIKGLDAPDNSAERVKSFLKSINEKLDKTPFKLGYRAANEALLYVSASYHFGQHDVEKALDEFTMMKILSRIEGDKRSMGNLLGELKEVITDAYPLSSKKLDVMIETLGSKQFVSYWV